LEKKALGLKLQTTLQAKEPKLDSEVCLGLRIIPLLLLIFLTVSCASGGTGDAPGSVPGGVSGGQNQPSIGDLGQDHPGPIPEGDGGPDLNKLKAPEPEDSPGPGDSPDGPHDYKL